MPKKARKVIRRVRRSRYPRGERRRYDEPFLEVAILPRDDDPLSAFSVRRDGDKAVIVKPDGTVFRVDGEDLHIALHTLGFLLNHHL